MLAQRGRVARQQQVLAVDLSRSERRIATIRSDRQRDREQKNDQDYNSFSIALIFDLFARSYERIDFCQYLVYFVHFRGLPSVF
jgi:hypothetical protein